MIQAILWDVDGTLLDFKKSEEYGIRACMKEIGFDDVDEEMLTRYEKINRSYWEALERGEITKQEVLIGRFKTFFAQEGICCPDVAAFNDSYHRKLGEIFFEKENSLEIIRNLHGRVKQYVVTNGTVVAQRAKLEKSGLGAYMDGVFISDEIGTEKPGIGFFTPVFAALQGIEKKDVLIVGDSLTSDMRGGNNAGFCCCWYNPNRLKNETDVRVDCEIHSLNEIEAVLRGFSLCESYSQVRFVNAV